MNIYLCFLFGELKDSLSRSSRKVDTGVVVLVGNTTQSTINGVFLTVMIQTRNAAERRERDKRSVERKRRRWKDKEKKRKSKLLKQAKKLVEEQNIQDIRDDDYFVKNVEFAYWLKTEKGVYFDELGTEESREIFKEFVQKWNARRLNRKCSMLWCVGDPSAGVTHDIAAVYLAKEDPAAALTQRTKHKWAFSSNISADVYNAVDRIQSDTNNESIFQVGVLV